MKNLVLLLLAALTLSLSPSAQAFERKYSWDDAANILNTLHAQMDRVHVYNKRFGAGPDLENEVQHLELGIADQDERVQSRRGDPKDAVTKARDLWDLMKTIQAEFLHRAERENVEIEVFHDEWRWK